MKQRILTIALVGVCIVFVLVLAGCLPQESTGVSFSDSPGQIQGLVTSPVNVGHAALRFSLKVDSYNGRASLQVATTTTNPTVTFVITSVQPGNMATPTIVASQTVSVTNGVVEATFQILALPTIASIRVEGGQIAGQSDFHGIADVVANPVLFAKVRMGACGQLFPLISRVDRASSAAVESLLSLWQTDGVPFSTVVTETPTVVQEISASTGTQTVTVTAASPLTGLKIDIPAGAFSTPTQLQVSCASVSSLSLPISTGRPVAPAIVVQSTGVPSSGPVSITVPTTARQDEIALAVQTDPTTGAVTVLPVTGYSNGQLTFSTQVNSSTSPSRRGLVTILPTILPIAVIAFPIADVISPDVDTGFRPQRDGWRTENCGSSLSQGGICTGMTLGAAWYYERYGRGGQSLYNFWTNGTTVWNSDSTKVAWQDDAQTIRFCSRLQKSSSVHGTGFDLNHTITFAAMKAALRVTKAPLFLGVADAQGGHGHALLVYRANGSTIWFYDPNYPGIERSTTFTNGQIQPVEMRLNPSQGQMPVMFTRFTLVAKASLIDWNSIGDVFDNVARGGLVGHPDLDFKTVSNGQVTPLDGLATSSTTIRIGVPALSVGAGSPEYYFYSYCDSTSHGHDFLNIDSSVQMRSADFDISWIPVGMTKTVGFCVMTNVADNVWLGYKEVKVTRLSAQAGTGTNGGTDIGVTDGLVAHYPLDGNANDASGLGRDGVAVNTTPAIDRWGRVNSAFSFDGVTSRVAFLPSSMASRQEPSQCGSNRPVGFGRPRKVFTCFLASQARVISSVLVRSAGIL